MAKIGEIARRITGMNKQKIINYDSRAHDHLRVAEIEKRHERQCCRPIPPALQLPRTNVWKRFTENIGDIVYKLGPG